MIDEPLTSAPDARGAGSNATSDRILWAVLLAVAAATMYYVLRSGVGRTGDTLALIGGTHRALDCVGDGTLTDCGIQVAPYPLLQYLPSALLIGLGFGDGDVERGLGLLNAVAFCGLLVVAWTTLRRAGDRALGALLVVVLLASPFPWYAWVTFGEAFGALACVAFVAAALRRSHPVLLALSFGLACVTKETALPFLVLMGGAALAWSPLAARPISRAHWIGLAAGAALGIVLTAGFNELRFGQLTNAVYSEPVQHTPTNGLKARFMLSLWLAPNAGLAVFWPLSAVAFAAFLACAAARARRWREHLRAVAAGAVLLVCLAAMTFGYANWYAPFGWIAWGPRLMLLLTPALLLFGAGMLGPELRAALSGLSRRAARIAGAAFAVLAVATVLAQVGVLFNQGAQSGLFTPDAECSENISVAVDSGGYYHCIIHDAWYKHWVLPEAAKGAWASVSSVAMTAVWLLAAALAALVALRALRAPAGPRGPAPGAPSPAPAPAAPR